jgi:hypothetical protein
MKCQEIQERFVELLYNESGTPAAGPELAAHVESCAACRKELEELRGLQSMLKTWPDEPPLRPVAVPRRASARPLVRWPLWRFARYAAVAALFVMAVLGLANADIRWDKSGFSFRTGLLSRPEPRPSFASDYYTKEEVSEIMQHFLKDSRDLNYQMIQRALEYVDEARSVDISYFKNKLKENRPKN